ncbi:unnamed protein product [Triticum turgidum subsp. durum]|uniref:Fe2OG dioxygenase domain-containing protein n=1 Tax=Triticum turgidum subsp. durum TaxID=4567 RepID=A0A9R1BW22_TRITD|nr:unnamed protein product [Triticum turgidum subsp. durum]
MVHQAQGLLVQEVAADGELPSRYVLKEQQGRPAAAAAAQRAAPSIPTVDVSRLADADPSEADKLRSALDSWGLFAVTGHGMTDPFLDAILGAARGFFHLPTEAKQEYSNVVDADDGGRKFQPEGYGVDRVDTDEQVLDWCDRLYLQVRPDKVGDRMPSYARFTYYPPCPRPDLVHGLKPHTDNSVVTVLLLDDQVGGLQVLKDGSWVDVPVLGDGRHQLLVVVGDEMEIMSNAAFRAPVHRVMAPGEEAERVSLAVFYQPEPDKVLEPSPELIDGDRPAMYKKLQAKVFADGFWDAFALGERTIDFLKVKVDAVDPPAAAVSGA